MVNFDFEKAINIRRSTRSFLKDELKQEDKKKIIEFINTLDYPFKHDIEFKFFEAEYDKKLYFGFDAPKDNIAFISETDHLSISKTGFIGELIILYATSLGISTCWIGHYALSELERLMPHLGEYKNSDNPKYGYSKGVVEGKRAICTTPLGYWKNKGARVFDRVQMRSFSYNRKPIEQLVVGDADINELSQELLYAIDLARKAPSALNKQFWRFDIASDQKTIRIAMPKGYKHPKWSHPNVDIGICACHFWLGLKIKGVEHEIDIKEEDGCAVWYFKIK